jgi:hypothetical protein
VNVYSYDAWLDQVERVFDERGINLDLVEQHVDVRGAYDEGLSLDQFLERCEEECPSGMGF